MAKRSPFRKQNGGIGVFARIRIRVRAVNGKKG